MRRVCLVCAAFLVCVLALTADAKHGPPVSKGGGSGPPILSLAKANWQLLTYLQFNSSAKFNDATSLYVNFPIGLTDSLNYLTSRVVPRSLLPYGVLSMTVRVDVTGAPIFNFKFPNDNNGGSVPANVRPMIWTDNNDLSEDYGRFWSNPTTVFLQPGTFEINVPLTPDRWSAVNGHFANLDAASMAGWQHAITNVSSLGMTLGGGDFFGHGVSLLGTGTASLHVLDYRVQ